MHVKTCSICCTAVLQPQNLPTAVLPSFAGSAAVGRQSFINVLYGSVWWFRFPNFPSLPKDPYEPSLHDVATLRADLSASNPCAICLNPLHLRIHVRRNRILFGRLSNTEIVLYSLSVSTPDLRRIQNILYAFRCPES